MTISSFYNRKQNNKVPVKNISCHTKRCTLFIQEVAPAHPPPPPPSSACQLTNTSDITKCPYKTAAKHLEPTFYHCQITVLHKISPFIDYNCVRFCATHSATTSRVAYTLWATNSINTVSTIIVRS